MNEADKEVAPARDDSDLMTVLVPRMTKDVARNANVLVTSAKALDDVSRKIACSFLEQGRA